VKKFLENEILAKRKKEFDILNLCKNNPKNVVLMPASQQSIYLAQYLKAHSICVDFFVDNSPDKQGTTINGTTVITFDEYKKISDEKLLILATIKVDIEKSIKKQLKENHIKNYECINADYFGYDANEIDNARILIVNNFDKYFKVYNMFSDDLSKKTLLNKLNYMISFDKTYLEKIVQLPEKQYFEPDIYKITSKDCFVDCGAFDGDTLDNLMRELNGNISAYYGFEPDVKNYFKFNKKIDKYKNIEIFNKGVYSKNTTLKFNLNNRASKIAEDGDIEIEVVSLDNTLGDKKITFIKMDVEGAEKEALLGARKTIQNEKPALAVCVYHKFDDLYVIPDLIQSFGVKYKYYLRHYTLGLAETVLYAVPE